MLEIYVHNNFNYIPGGNDLTIWLKSVNISIIKLMISACCIFITLLKHYLDYE